MNTSGRGPLRGYWLPVRLASEAGGFVPPVEHGRVAEDLETVRGAPVVHEQEQIGRRAAHRDVALRVLGPEHGHRVWGERHRDRVAAASPSLGDDTREDRLMATGYIVEFANEGNIVGIGFAKGPLRGPQIEVEGQLAG